MNNFGSLIQLLGTPNNYSWTITIILTLIYYQPLSWEQVVFFFPFHEYYHSSAMGTFVGHVTYTTFSKDMK